MPRSHYDVGDCFRGYGFEAKPKPGGRFWVVFLGRFWKVMFVVLAKGFWHGVVHELKMTVRSCPNITDCESTMSEITWNTCN